MQATCCGRRRGRGKPARRATRLAEAVRRRTALTDKAPALDWCVTMLGILLAGLLDE